MTLYITKNGQQMGPYTLAEAQALQQAGTVTGADMAWYEGIPNWIPLNHVPGFYIPPPVPPAPTPRSIPYTPPVKSSGTSWLKHISVGLFALVIILLKFLGPLLIFFRSFFEQ